MTTQSIPTIRSNRLSAGLRSQTTMPHLATVLETRGVTKTFRNGSTETSVLKGVDLEIKKGQLTAIVGKSGSGKSTLLHLLGTLDRPDDGEILYQGSRIDHLSTKRTEKIRNEEIGLIFQFYHLLPELSVLENVLTPLMVRHGFFFYMARRAKFKKKALNLLERVGLSHRLNHKPLQLSGGERQRTAIARALISDPKLLLADEPTGNLDSENSEEVLTLLSSLNKEDDMTIVMVTHDDQIANSADRIITVANGVVV